MDPFEAPRHSDEQAPVAVELDWSQSYARRAAYGVYVVVFSAGFISGANPRGDANLLAALAVGWAITYFCALDARAHRVVFPHSFWLFTALTWPIAPLFHLVRVRGSSGVITYWVHALGAGFCGFAGVALGRLLEK
ncbi:MAG TPA: hypothetical protein VHM25_00155 [Polyangiaceae bacterium]|jgi:hypothetical protein|nr:hypothetical protein [Polyangiaceae bacterium]